MGRGACSDIQYRSCVFELVANYSCLFVCIVRLKTAPLLPITMPPKLCITGGQIRRSKKPIFLSKVARYIRREYMYNTYSESEYSSAGFILFLMLYTNPETEYPGGKKW